MYKEGLKKTKVATTAISLMISAVPGCGWGFQQFPYKKKGIKVYYKIHKSVMSMNKVRYVVG